MRKVLLFFCILHVIIFAEDFTDKDPTGITDKDIKLLKDFDELSYKLSNSKIKVLSVNKIYQFIQQNKVYIDDFSLLHVNLKASAGIDDYDYKSERERDKNFKKIYLEVSYPIFDQKTKRERQKQIIKDDNAILKNIQQYAKYFNSYHAKKRKLEFLRFLLIRDKVQVKSGVKYLDEKIIKLDKLLEVQNQIGETRQLLEIYQNILLNYVMPEQRNNLRKILHVH